MYLQLLLWDGNETQKPSKLASSPPDTKGFHRVHQPFNFNDQQYSPHPNLNTNAPTKNNDAAATGHPTPQWPRPPAYHDDRHRRHNRCTILRNGNVSQEAVKLRCWSMREDWTAVRMESLTGGPETTDANGDASLALLSSDFLSLALLIPHGSTTLRGLCQTQR